MFETIILFVLVALIFFQVLHAVKYKDIWNLLVQINSIGIKLLLVFILYSNESGLIYLLDIVLVLLVLNVVGTIIISRFISKN